MIKPGTYIQYRDRVETDPPKSGTDKDGWGERGIVIRSNFWEFFNTGKGQEDAIEFLSEKGHFIVAAARDVKVVREVQ